MNCSSKHITDINSILARQLVSHGVKRVFVSPGSRNASIINCLASTDGLDIDMIVDERSAAFVALGYASTAQEPVAIVCTSGTAPLNYSPAVCEAFYRHIPLIVVTADRPWEWINQDDSQTMIQQNIYRDFIQVSVDIPVLTDASSVWLANRSINEAMLAAVEGAGGPVHINLHISQPDATVDVDARLSNRIVSQVLPKRYLPEDVCCKMAEDVAMTKKVMVIAGFHHPDSKLNSSLAKLSQLPNVVVLTETISNLASPWFIPAIDLTIKQISDIQMADYQPELVITIGGALISRRIKSMLRNHKPAEHWHVGLNENVIDNFQCLTRMIKSGAPEFFTQLCEALPKNVASSDYADRWRILADRGSSILQSTVMKSDWSDLVAFSTLLPMIPKRYNLHFSNGTAIRYAQLFGRHGYHRCECNRGVSGIDGCTSTAVGGSLAYEGTTLLITGDMSALYDMSALASGCLTPRFKMIVINNRGGGIFRFVGSTKNLPVRDKYLSGDIHFPAKELAEAFGLAYYSASSECELRQCFSEFAYESSKPAMLEIVTNAEPSAEILDRLLN